MALHLQDEEEQNLLSGLGEQQRDMKKRVQVPSKKKRRASLLNDGSKPQRNVLRRLESRPFHPSLRRPDFRREQFLGFAITRKITTATEGERPQQIVEILSSPHFLFVLTAQGLCLAYSHNSEANVHCLNSSPDEVVRAMFYNSLNDSLVMVSVNKDDGYCALRCRSLPIMFVPPALCLITCETEHCSINSYIQRNRVTEWLEPFASELLSWPGFIEFDDINDHAITFSASTNTYKIWELKNYELLYTINGTDVAEVKISADLLLLVHHPTDADITFRILDAKSGQEINRYVHILEGGRPIEFAELFLHKLFIKQESAPLIIFDIRSRGHQQIESAQFVKPSAFIFLHERRVFLTFQQGQISVWDLNGKLINKFEDHQLWTSDDASAIHITARQDLVVSFCMGDGFFDDGTINISDVMSGKCFAKIGTGDDTRQEDERARALNGVSAIHFSEERLELYTGNKAGIVCVWSN